MKTKVTVKKCGDVFISRSADYSCELPIDHRGKHRGGGWADVPGGVYWTRQGAERIAREIAAEKGESGLTAK
jgi:hypothetical protein